MQYHFFSSQKPNVYNEVFHSFTLMALYDVIDTNPFDHEDTAAECCAFTATRSERRVLEIGIFSFTPVSPCGEPGSRKMRAPCSIFLIPALGLSPAALVCSSGNPYCHLHDLARSGFSPAVRLPTPTRLKRPSREYAI